MPKTRESISLAMRFAILRRDRHACQYCGAKAPDTALHIDHVVPVYEGGTNDPGNLITACFRCNLGKGVSAATTDEERPLTERERLLSWRSDWWLGEVTQSTWATEVYASESPEVRLIIYALTAVADSYGGVMCSSENIAKATGLPVADVLRIINGLERVAYVIFVQNGNSWDEDICLCLNFHAREDNEHCRLHRMSDYGQQIGFPSVARIYA